MPRAATLALVLLLLSSALTLSVPTPARAASAQTVGTIPLPPDQNGGPNGIVGSSAAYYCGSTGCATYVMGGRLEYSASGGYSSAIWRDDPSTHQMVQVATLPLEPGATDAGHQDGAAVAIGSTIYYFGGAVIVCAQLNPPPAPCSAVPKSAKSIIAFNPDQAIDNVTNPKIVATLPDGLWGLEAIVDGGKAYLFGGFTFDVTNVNDIARRDWILQFDPSGTLGPIVTKLQQTLPYPEQDGAAAFIGGSAYILGGLGNNDNVTNPCPHNIIPDSNGTMEDKGPAPVCASDGIVALSISLQGDVQSRGVVAHLPYRAQFVNGAAVNNKIYVPGARLQSGDASDKIVEFDPSSASPVRVLVPTLPSPFFAAPAATDGTRIWLYGGRHASLTDMIPNITEIYPGPTVAWAPRDAVARPSLGQVSLTWQPPAYDGDSPVTGYRIYRTAEGDQERQLTDVTTISYVDKNVQPNTNYVYRITTLNAKGESTDSAFASTAAGAVPPGAVASFSLSEGDQQILLTWTPPLDDGGSNLTAYRIYLNGSGQPIEVDASTHEYLVTGLADGVAYTFNVMAVNSKGEGDPSPTLRGVPKAVPPPPTGVSAGADATDKVTLAWTPPAVHVDGFVVLRGTDPAALGILANVTSGTTQYVDTTAQAGHTYYYAVASENAAGAGLRSDLAQVALVTKPSPPQTVFALALEGAIRVTWQAPSDPGIADPAQLSYTIVRDGIRIRTDVTGNAFLDKPLAPGQPHAYAVIAFNGLESDPSATSTAAAKAVQTAPPKAVLTVLTSVVQPGDTVQLDLSQSAPGPNSRLVDYALDFGDGSPIVHTTTPTATHVYTKNDTYTVTLTVKDDKGQETSATAQVIVGDPTTTNPNIPPDTMVPTPAAQQQPGAKSGKLPVPGPEALLTLAAVAAIAALRRRRS
jgi:MYXO-CTERM domain-containing protein